MRYFIFIVSLFCVMCVLKPDPAKADGMLKSQVASLAQTVQELKTMVQSQAAEMQLLRRRLETQSVSMSVPPAPETVRQTQGVWNPAIGVVADTLLTLDSPK